MEREKTLGYEFRTISNMIKRHIDREVVANQTEPITRMQGWTIGFLYDRQDRDVFQRDVEEEFEIQRSTATRMLQLMEKRGFIVRQPVASDGRLKKICLTDKGRAFHQVVIHGAQSIERQLEEGLTAQEREAFFAITAKIRKNLEK